MMELTPTLYRYIIRPNWFTRYYIHSLVLNEFDFREKFVLEFGSGVGTNCKMFDPKWYLGIDCDVKRVKYASRLFGDYKFASISGPDIPLLNKSVDYVLIISVLHHIPTPLIPQYLNEFNRLLNDNGTIIVLEPCCYKRNGVSDLLMKCFDKGKYITDADGYLSLFRSSSFETTILRMFSQLFIYKKILFSASPLRSQ